ncbi:MAG: phosphohistidine phosphatase SixA [Elusimicrobiota bacterium]
MNILIIRHAPAGNSEQWLSQGKKDSLRPLTPEGREKMQKTAAGLKSQLDGIDLIVSSPYVRCRQTVEILALAFPEAKKIEWAALRPGGGFKDIPAKLAALNDVASVALVGHEPTLSLLGSHLLSGRQGAFIRLRKGGCALLEAPVPVRPGRAVLQWLLQSKQLRKLGKKAD